jgi:hypothetical protein
MQAVHLLLQLLTLFRPLFLRCLGVALLLLLLLQVLVGAVRWGVLLLVAGFSWFPCHPRIGPH